MTQPLDGVFISPISTGDEIVKPAIEFKILQESGIGVDSILTEDGDYILQEAAL